MVRNGRFLLVVHRIYVYALNRYSDSLEHNIYTGTSYWPVGLREQPVKGFDSRYFMKSG
jgi:hypothetical protein